MALESLFGHHDAAIADLEQRPSSPGAAWAA
jgi:hypothetical protein